MPTLAPLASNIYGVFQQYTIFILLADQKTAIQII